jgi:hypothetical protein
MESDGRFYVGAVGKTGSSRRECVFAFAYFVNTFYKGCTLSEISQDGAAVNCASITVKHKKGAFPSTLTGHTTIVIIYHHTRILSRDANT